MNENYEEIAMEAARRQLIVDGWKKYRFPGEPPKEGSQVEQRMITIAMGYVSCAYSKKLRHKDHASNEVQYVSEAEQRVLHNQLAMMIFGESRTTMEYNRAKSIKEFAVSIAYPGFSPEEVSEMLNSEVQKN